VSIASEIPPTLGLADPFQRVVADAGDRVAWLRARSRGITATDAALLTSDAGIASVVRRKIEGDGFRGNAFTDHGRAREAAIAAWTQREHGIDPSTLLFHAATDRRHLATPDGLRIQQGRIELAEYKTTSKPWRSVPRSYLRQVWWQQYVLGAERTLVVWEEHHNFVPVAAEPRWCWIDRDEDEIAALVYRADEVLLRLATPTR